MDVAAPAQGTQVEGGSASKIVIDAEECCVRAALASSHTTSGGVPDAAVVDASFILGKMHSEGTIVLRASVSENAADALRIHVDAALAESLQMAMSDPAEEKARFGDVLSRDHRYDLKLRIESPPVRTALRHLFGGGGGARALYEALRGLLGDDAELDELACMISDPGARRQPVHPDTPAEVGEHDHRPVMITGFVALQDIRIDMGPTVLWAATHTVAAHATWEEERVSFLERSVARVATLRKGDLLLFDSRVLHCGGSNLAESGGRRRIFYFSLKRARRATGKSGPGTLRAELRGGRYRIDDLPPL